VSAPDVKKAMEFLLGHFDAVRQKGNSTAIREGSNNVDALVVCGTKDMGDCAGFPAKQVVSMHNLDRLRGHEQPVVFDHTALGMLFGQALDRIDMLEREVQLRGRILKRIRESMSMFTEIGGIDRREP
jgi:hypothetical protein